MKLLLWVGGAAVLLGPWLSRGVSGAQGGLRLPAGQDNFFVEDDLVYSRSLCISHDGTYRQINRDSAAAKEVDRGTWEQASDATVRLHSTYRGLRFRALLSGPLAVVLDSPEKIAALPEVAGAIRRLLAAAQDAVFAADTAREFGSAEAKVTVDRQAETFRREDLASLAAEIDDTIWTEESHTYVLSPVRPAGMPLLLVLKGAVYGVQEVARVAQEYKVKKGTAPPFYFAQTKPQTFANQVGNYQDLPVPVRPVYP